MEKYRTQVAQVQNLTTVQHSRTFESLYVGQTNAARSSTPNTRSKIEVQRVCSIGFCFKIPSKKIMRSKLRVTRKLQTQNLNRRYQNQKPYAVDCASPVHIGTNFSPSLRNQYKG
jgi:hypothetical protein